MMLRHAMKRCWLRLKKKKKDSGSRVWQMDGWKDGEFGKDNHMSPPECLFIFLGVLLISCTYVSSPNKTDLTASLVFI